MCLKCLPLAQSGHPLLAALHHWLGYLEQGALLLWFRRIMDYGFFSEFTLTITGTNACFES